jgi:hypothetical protein
MSSYELPLGVNADIVRDIVHADIVRDVVFSDIAADITMIWPP